MENDREYEYETSVERGCKGEKHSKHFEIMHALHRIKRVNIAAIMEIPSREFFILMIIEKSKQNHPDKEGIYVSVIAERAQMASSQVSRMLKSLEERELIGRSVDAKDRRNTYVFLTEKGKSFCEKVGTSLEDYFSRVMKVIGEETIDELSRICNDLADVMEKELEEIKKEKRNDESDGKNI